MSANKIETGCPGQRGAAIGHRQSRDVYRPVIGQHQPRDVYLKIGLTAWRHVKFPAHSRAALHIFFLLLFNDVGYRI